MESHFQREVGALYSDHHGWLRGWLRKKLGNAFDAADLAHDTYLRVLSSGLAPQAEDARRYLTRIANCLVIDLFRRRHIESAYLEALAALPEPVAPSPETRALVLEALIEIDTLLARLPAKARTAFLLCKLEGLGYREIAGRLQVSVSSVEKYVAQALRECYAVQYGSDT
ncbi:sigma-70 family RNA polymerase sigma factor [Pandoraea apista]|uniref:Sigma-70 family RNA polymerase sigma factor n=1 Tax=Pandoraea apista TaxID=93218 RepID=A0ABX9ZV77_9BURK|nr:sigma-70 family RNA polymerase sigma factor [Pandoraea apista]ALS64419.1 RNA polymerase subunit sigma [Pandoraea apista]AVF41005.1 RNA polymerase subunit sigma [Pandoraea apista]PTE02071.1 RNA polymerase subunit sigma [Pandoraea apista]RRW99378.1 sigma-70 family RNA polymerase sigma factor [Pandoraea apista]RRX07695.1 sigma-70 family RNA polymerase sigma factor [Pandoraea apista]